MTASLWDVLKEQLAELRDLLARPLREPRASDILKDVFGPNCTTGESTVIELALFDDLLRMTEIVLAGRWKPLEPHFTRFALPFFQTAADAFVRNGQPGYAAFVHLSPAEAGRFLEHRSQSPQPFGGRASADPVERIDDLRKRFPSASKSRSISRLRTTRADVVIGFEKTRDPRPPNGRSATIGRVHQRPLSRCPRPDRESRARGCFGSHRNLRGSGLNSRPCGPSWNHSKPGWPSGKT